MLFEQTKFKIILVGSFFSLTVGLGGCGNSAQLEGFFRADPNLQRETEQTPRTANLQANSSEEVNASQDSAQKEIKLTKLPKKSTATEVTDLPATFPLYPQANLELITPESTEEQGVSQWRSPDSIETIVSYYQQKWQDQNWEVIEPFTSNPNTRRHTAIVRRDNIDFTLFLTPILAAEEGEQLDTELEIIYQTAQSNERETAEDTISNSEIATAEENAVDVQNNSEALQSDRPTSANNSNELTEVPEDLQQYVQEVAALGITQPLTTENPVNASITQPNEPITRGEYAQWLVKANNKYYGGSSGNKIRLASKSSEPVFKDVNASDPRFAAIQGLAEIGLIPSSLTGDSSSLLFQPDAPLTREDLIAWKVPLDVRTGLPKADANAIQEAWGFQDAAKINPAVFSALFADYQNSDRSNLKRVFGYTTLFQPKKTVTRAEAAASLWSFGYQGEGITAPEKLKENP